MAGNEVEDGNNARDPADEDDGNSGNSCLPLILIVQWLLNDHVDSLIKRQISTFCKTSFKHLQEISDCVAEASDENVDEDDFEDDEDSESRSGSAGVKADPVVGTGPAGSSVV